MIAEERSEAGAVIGNGQTSGNTAFRADFIFNIRKICGNDESIDINGSRDTHLLTGV